MWTTPKQPFRVPTPDDAQGAERLVFLSTSTGMPAGRPIEMRLDSVFRSETVKAIDFHPRAPEMLVAGRGHGFVWLVNTDEGKVIRGYNVDSVMHQHDTEADTATDEQPPPTLLNDISGLAGVNSDMHSMRVDEKPAWESTIRAIKFLPLVDAFVCGTEAGDLYVIDLHRGELVAEVAKNKHGDVRAICTHPTERIVLSCGDDKRVYLWTYARWPQWECLRVLRGHEHYVMGLSLHPEATLQRLLFASVSFDTTLHLWTMDVHSQFPSESQKSTRRRRRTSKLPANYNRTEPNDAPATWSTAPELKDARPSYRTDSASVLASSETVLHAPTNAVVFVQEYAHDQEPAAEAPSLEMSVNTSFPGIRRKSVRYADTPDQVYRLVTAGTYTAPEQQPRVSSGGAESESWKRLETLRHKHAHALNLDEALVGSFAANVVRGAAVHVLEPPDQHFFTIHAREADYAAPAAPVASIDAPMGHGVGACAVSQFPGLAATASVDGLITFVRVGCHATNTSPAVSSTDRIKSLVGGKAYCVAAAPMQPGSRDTKIAVGGPDGFVIITLAAAAPNMRASQAPDPISLSASGISPRATLRPWVPSSIVRLYGRKGRTVTNFAWCDGRTCPRHSGRLALSLSSDGGGNDDSGSEGNPEMRKGFGCFTVEYLDAPSASRGGVRVCRKVECDAFRVLDDRMMGETAPESLDVSQLGDHDAHDAEAALIRKARQEREVSFAAVHPPLAVAIQGTPRPPATASQWLALAEFLAETPTAADWAAFDTQDDTAPLKTRRIRVSAWQCADRALETTKVKEQRRFASRIYAVLGRLLTPSPATKFLSATGEEVYCRCRVYAGRALPLTDVLCLEVAVGLDWDNGAAWLELASRLLPGESCKPRLMPGVQIDVSDRVVPLSRRASCVPSTLRSPSRADMRSASPSMSPREELTPETARRAANDERASEQRRELVALRFSAELCAAEACRCQPYSAVAWGTLARLLKADYAVDVGTRYVDAFEAHVQHCGLDPAAGVSWYALSVLPWPPECRETGANRLDGAPLIDPRSGEHVRDPQICREIALATGYEPPTCCASKSWWGFLFGGLCAR
jgi:hypothetical protein